jgi:hypothetical protein
MGLDVYLSRRTGTHDDGSFVGDSIEQRSTIAPDHLFKIGYFRSSYNDAGINSTLRRWDIPDLYAIFEPGERYEFVPDWKAARDRCDKSIALLVEFLSSFMGKYDCMAVSGFDAVPSEETALAIFAKQSAAAGRGEWGGGFSNREGVFYLQGIKAFAFIDGSRFNQRCTYVIYERPPEDGQHYLTSLRIVRETIDYVLAEPEPTQFYLSWSS